MTLAVGTDLPSPLRFHPEPRCHVCRSDSIRERVNALLAAGSSYAQIVRAVAAEDSDPVSLDSVRTHAARHFPVQNAARATYREIVERRAAENQIDFVAGLATAVTPMAYLEALMVKAFGRLVADGTEVGLETGLRAAERLQAVLDARAPDSDVVRMQVEVGRIIDAVKAVVPTSMWGDIADRLNGPRPAPCRLQSERSEVAVDDDDDDDF